MPVAIQLDTTGRTTASLNQSSRQISDPAAAHVGSAAPQPSESTVLIPALPTGAAGSVEQNSVEPQPPVKPAIVSPPATQVAEAVISSVKSGGSTQQTTINLHPADLGTVQIRIERLPLGATKIAIIAEKPETLTALQSSQAQLHQNLDLAGLPSSARSISLHSATEASIATSASTDHSTPSGRLDDASSATGQSGSQTAGGNGRDNPPAKPRDIWSGERASLNGPSSDAIASTTSNCSSLNITA